MNPSGLNPGPSASGPAGSYADYLVEWRTGLWQSIRHKELLIWSFIAFYVAALGLIAGPGRETIGGFTGLIAVLLLSLLGVHVVLDANLWHARNLFTISRIEKLFIGDQKGILIPESYLEYKYRFNKIYSIHLQLLGLAVVGSYYGYVWHSVYIPGHKLTSVSALLELTLSTIAGVTTFFLIRRFGRDYRDIYFRFREEFEKDVGGNPLPKPDLQEKTEADLRDPTWLMAAVGVSLILALFNAALLVNIEGYFHQRAISFAGWLGIAGFVTWGWMKWSSKPSLDLQKRLQSATNVVVVSSLVVYWIYVVVNRCMIWEAVLALF